MISPTACSIRPGLVWVLAAAALLLAPSPAAAVGLADSVARALAFNPDLRVVASDRRAVEQELAQARALLWPSLEVRLAAGPEWSRNDATRRPGGNDSKLLLRSEARLVLRQRLFDGYATRSEIARQQARLTSAARRVREAAEFVALDAVRAHLEVLRLSAIVELNRDNLETHERWLAKVRRLEQAGRVSIADLRQAEARVAQARENLAVAEGQLRDAEAAYRRVVGEPPGALELDFEPAGGLPAGADEAAALAAAASPTVQIRAADVRVAEAELRAARAGFYPRLDLELAAAANNGVLGDTDENASASALLLFRYDLYRGGADLAREREAFHRLNQARAELARARLEAERTARQAFNALQTARTRLEALAERAEAQRRTRDAYAQQFDLGQRGLLDLLDAENELFLARADLISARFIERFAAFRLLAVTGQLLEQLGLEPPQAARSATPPTPAAELEAKAEPLKEP